MSLDPRTYNPAFSLGAQLAEDNMTYQTGATGPTNTVTGAIGATGPTGPTGAGP